MINAEGLQNLGLWLWLTVIVQSGIFIVTRDLVGLIGRNASFSRLLRQSMIYNNLDLHGIYRKKSNGKFFNPYTLMGYILDKLICRYTCFSTCIVEEICNEIL